MSFVHGMYTVHNFVVHRNLDGSGFLSPFGALTVGGVEDETRV